MVKAELFVVVHLSAVNDNNPVELRVKGTGPDQGMDKTGVLALSSTPWKTLLPTAATFRAELDLAVWPANGDAARDIAQGALQSQLGTDWSIGALADSGHSWGNQGWQAYGGLETPRAFVLENSGNEVRPSCNVEVKQPDNNYQTKTLEMPVWVVFQKLDA